ncbi:helix-turn-helix transcriptional regulator [Nocardioides litoris]|uniref:helix-turn-helix transcriptional regulator n=1 Tax=Nocardioides litoris TaxID=1926648 RepID=UPI00111EBDC4|nr:response regulator transcription factor [Nocardioides litoris]
MTARVAVVSPLEVVSTGLAAMLGHHPSEVEVVPLATGRDAVDPDVVLYDAAGLHQGDGADLDFLVRETTAAVLVVSQDLRPDLASRALARGADGLLPLGVHEAELLDAVLGATRADGERGTAAPRVDAVEHRLGHDVGLTPREVDVLALITQGLSNQEIAERSYLSINSVKTYVRSAYRRIGVATRSQAVVWCLQHGFSVDLDDNPGPRN